jgi:hypothetical protein
VKTAPLWVSDLEKYSRYQFHSIIQSICWKDQHGFVDLSRPSELVGSCGLKLPAQKKIAKSVWKFALFFMRRQNSYEISSLHIDPPHHWRPYQRSHIILIFSQTGWLLPAATAAVQSLIFDAQLLPVSSQSVANWIFQDFSKFHQPVGRWVCDVYDAFAGGSPRPETRNVTSRSDKSTTKWEIQHPCCQSIIWGYLGIGAVPERNALRC